MNVFDLARVLNAECLTPSISMNGDILSGYSCDLLSWVMAHAKRGSAWITVQTHLNVIAVASLLDISCIVLPENITMGQESINKAIEESIPILKCSQSAFSICGLMIGSGIS